MEKKIHTYSLFHSHLCSIWCVHYVVVYFVVRRISESRSFFVHKHLQNANFENRMKNANELNNRYIHIWLSKYYYNIIIHIEIDTLRIYNNSRVDLYVFENLSINKISWIYFVMKTLCPCSCVQVFFFFFFVRFLS